MIQYFLKKYFYNLKIGRKIGLGYALALGVAVSGTITSFIVGDYYQYLTEKKEERAHQETELLTRLHSRILQTQNHQQKLLLLNKNLEELQEESEHLLKYKGEMQQTWAELKIFVEASPNLMEAEYQKKLITLLHTYDQVPQRYNLELEWRLEYINNLDLTKPDEVEKGQALLRQLTSSSAGIELDSLADDFVEIINDAYYQLEKAEKSQKKGIKVAEKIVTASILLSIIVATLLAIFISRAIAQPLENLTQVAQRSTEQSDFDLQAHIQHNDEIGLLANTFNQLIRSVKELLDKQKKANKTLEKYSQSLEIKIEERNQILQELKITQAQMLQSEKLSALGKMVAGIAHEINNPVSFIHGNLSYVQEYASSLIQFLQVYQNYYPNPVPEITAEAEALDIEFIQADLPKILNSMKVGTARIHQIVLSLRNFSRLDEAEMKAVDIHEGIDSTVLILQHRLSKTSKRPAIQVICDYDSLPKVECYPGQLNQVFMNILANAIDALEERMADCTYQELEKNPGQIRIQTINVDYNWIKIIISDNGIGISLSVKKQIFDPFFTTKEIGRGTGMGLPISYQVITEKHSGKLECFSKLDEGTKFIIEIPIHQPIDKKI